MAQPWDVGVGNGTQEQNGTYDMMGNVNEWNESIFSGSRRVFRGGSYGNSNDSYPASLYRDGYSMLGEDDVMSFRIVEIVPIPNSSAVILGTIGFGFVTWLRRRRTI